MKTLKLREFILAEDDFVYVPIYNDRKLYVLGNEKSLLYIGISEKCIWSRWFTQRSAHMFIGNNYSLVGYTHAGVKVVNNLPESLFWNMDLWSIEELLDFMEIEHSWVVESEKYRIFDPISERERLCDVKYLESLMIRYLYPRYNVMGNNRAKAEEYFLAKYLKIVNRED